MANKKKSDEELKILDEEAKVVREKMKAAIDNLETKDIIAFRDLLNGMYESFPVVEALPLIIKKFNKKEFKFLQVKSWK